MSGGIAGEWRETTLGEFVRLQRGHDLTAKERKPGDYPVMGSAGPNGTHSEFIAHGPGVVIGRSGASMGKVHFTPDDYWPHNTCLYVTDFLGNDPRFAFYLLGLLDLASYNSGSAQPSLNRNFIYTKPIQLPPPSEQRTIAHILGTLDDKIELNRKQNETLEAMARTLFKAWFVDFEPVRTKLEGRWQRGQSLPGLPAHLYDLFPDRLVESELGEIPKGWRVGALSDLCELKYGKALKATERRKGNVPVYGSGGVTGFHDEALVKKPTIIVGRKGTVGSLYWESKSCYPIDTVFYVKPKVSLHYCYYAMERLGLHNMNTDAAVPGLNRDNAYRQEVIVPSTEVFQSWDILAADIRMRIDGSEQQSHSLAQLRDTLLPKLISGELRVVDVNHLMEAVND